MSFPQQGQVPVPTIRSASAYRCTMLMRSPRCRNLGSGVMPVDVAATRGERFTKDGSASSDYREVRTTATLGAGGSCDVVIACPFEPERVVVDPDAKVLQLRRKSATAKF